MRLKHLFSPPTGDELQRAAGIASMMRLPVKEKTDGKQYSFIHFSLCMILYHGYDINEAPLT